MSDVVKSTAIKQADIETAKKVFTADAGTDKDWVQQGWSTSGTLGKAGIVFGMILASITVIPALVIGGQAIYTAYQNNQRSFTKVLGNYAEAQAELAPMESAKGENNVHLTLEQRKAIQSTMYKGEKARTTLVGRVLDLTSKAKPEAAKARLEAAQQLIDESLSSKQVNEEMREQAKGTFMTCVRETAVRNVVNKMGLNLSGNVDETIDKHAEEMVARGYFTEDETAKKAIIEAYAAFVQKQGEERVNKQIEALEDGDAVEAAVDGRVAKEVAAYKQLVAERNALFDPEKADEIAEAEAERAVQKAKKKRRGAEEDDEVPVEKMSLTYNNGKLGAAEKAIRAIDVELQKNDKAFTKLDLDPDALKADAEAAARKPGKRKFDKNMTSGLELLKKREAAIVRLEKAQKEIAELEKDYRKKLEAVQEKEELIGDDMENPDTRNVQARIEAENQDAVAFLREMLSRPLQSKKAGSRESQEDLTRQLVQIGQVQRSLACFEVRENRDLAYLDRRLEVGDEASELSDDERISEEMLRSIPGLMERVAADCGIEGNERVNAATAALSSLIFNEENSAQVLASIKIQLQLIENRIGKQLDRMDDVAARASYLV